MIDKKTQGSWLIFQTSKLQRVTDQSTFENTYLAGKSGVLLSAISKDVQGTLNQERVNALAKASGINTKTELPILLDTLERRSLIEKGKDGIEVLGITTAACLQHTADIFDEQSPSAIERASIELCETSSEQPQSSIEIKERLSDVFKLSNIEAQSLIGQSSEIGFVETEVIDTENSLLFNGNLFRRDNVEKVSKVLSSLTQEESSKMVSFNEMLLKDACVPLELAEKHLGKKLFSKLTSVGLYDVSVVSNDQEEVAYITKPSAFGKFSNSLVDDAFDLAKMFVSSLTYGMTRSTYMRGQIRRIEALMRTLISGEPVGPVTAIGQDYKLLELKHVVEVFQGSKKGRSGYMMRLLKKEVGVLALEVIKNADASVHSLDILPTAAVNRFRGPEQNRESIRRKEVIRNPRATNDILLALRTGGKIK